MPPRHLWPSLFLLRHLILGEAAKQEPPAFPRFIAASCGQGQGSGQREKQKEGVALLRTLPVEENMKASPSFLLPVAWNVGVMARIPAATLGHPANPEGKPHHGGGGGQEDGRVLSLGHLGAPIALGCLPGSGLFSQDRERGTHLLKSLLCATKCNPYEHTLLSFTIFLVVLAQAVFRTSLRTSLFDLKISPVSCLKAECIRNK